MTIEELDVRNDEIRTRLRQIDEDGKGRVLIEDELAEWNRISDELETNERAIKQMQQRKDWLSTIDDEKDRREQGVHFGVPPASSQTAREDIWDLTTIRSNFGDPNDMIHEAKDRAARAIDTFVFPHPEIQRGKMISQEDVKQHLVRLMETVQEEQPGDFARYILKYGSPLYKRAFGKSVMGATLTSDETRALALSPGSAGGFAVPITLDPTLIPTSNGVVNPMRRIARIETIIGLEYRGLTAGAVVASYAPEGTEASDNTPVLAQPDLYVERAQAFVPYSIEIGMDWNGLQAGMAKLIQDAKDVLEGLKFTLGSGHGSNEPQGLITGATSTVATGTSSAFAIADLYALEQALPPRFRPLGQWFANRAIYNQVRQFTTQATPLAALWQTVVNPNVGPLGIGLDNMPFEEGGNIGQKLLGYGANEVSDMVSVLTHGSSILAIGDPNYYIIIDRIGMTIELIPHLFGSNRRPTGQRGLYAYWRNTGAVVDPNAWRILVT
jgi:HK97 family phage major capsid protein